MDLTKQSIAQNVKIRCRACIKEIYRKNYKTHLQTVHPSQNSEDLSPFGQQKSTSMFSAPKNPVQQQKPPVESSDVFDHSRAGVLVHGDVGVEGDDEGSLSLGASSKRRHESGESVESGYVEEDSSSTPKKKRENAEDKNEALTLETINIKIDMILENVKQNENSVSKGKIGENAAEQSVCSSIFRIYQAQ